MSTSSTVTIFVDHPEDIGSVVFRPAYDSTASSGDTYRIPAWVSVSLGRRDVLQLSPLAAAHLAEALARVLDEQAASGADS